MILFWCEASCWKTWYYRPNFRTLFPWKNDKLRCISLALSGREHKICLLCKLVCWTLPLLAAPCFGLVCDWTEWFDVSKPDEGDGDYETYEAIRKVHGDKICEAPEKIQCRAAQAPDMSLEELGQKVECNVTYGLICRNEDQDVTMGELCYNYEIRVNCCKQREIPCEGTTTPGSTPTATSATRSTTVPITPTTRQTTTTTTTTPTPTFGSESTAPVTTPGI